MFDRRIAKRVDGSADGTFERAERYVYDGEDIALVYDGAGSLKNRYLQGPALDEFFADENALGEVLWGLGDNQGTVRDVVKYDAATDATSVVNHLKYDSFGKITGQSNPAKQPLYASGSASSTAAGALLGPRQLAAGDGRLGFALIAAHVTRGSRVGPSIAELRLLAR